MVLTPGGAQTGLAEGGWSTEHPALSTQKAGRVGSLFLHLAARRRQPDCQEDSMSAEIELTDLSGFSVAINETKYSPTTINALRSGTYEIGERTCAQNIFKRGDRVLEI